MESNTKTSELDKNENNKQNNIPKISNNNHEELNKKDNSGDGLMSSTFIYKSNSSQSSFPLLFK